MLFMADGLAVSYIWKLAEYATSSGGIAAIFCG
jgi:hypothetical protein